MMGFGSLQALSAASLSDMVTCGEEVKKLVLYFFVNKNVIFVGCLLINSNNIFPRWNVGIFDPQQYNF